MIGSEGVVVVRSVISQKINSTGLHPQYCSFERRKMCRYFWAKGKEVIRLSSLEIHGSHDDDTFSAN